MNRTWLGRAAGNDTGVGAKFRPSGRVSVLGHCTAAGELHNRRMKRLATVRALDSTAIDRALEQLSELVHRRGLKSSSVRDAVARAALARRGHFTVDELIHDLRRKGVDGVHPATVYRVLPLLVEAGLLQAALMSSGDSARYERAFEREHHDHLICTECGQVLEFQSEAIEVLQREVAETFGFDLTGHVHELLGRCQQCAKRAR
jgi:Fur family transcriptional regulator, ferric uptake regulator